MENLKRFLKKAMVLLCCFTICISAFACGGTTDVPSGGDESGQLDIIVADQGFGTLWLKNVIEGFKEKYPNVQVELKTQKLLDKVNLYLTSNKKNPYDIIFTEGSQVFTYAETPYTIPGIEECYEDITDVYNAIPEGEAKPIKEKMYDGIYEYFKTSDEKTYVIPYAMTLFGFMYNTDLISDDELPNTTNELVELCKAVEKRNESKGVNAIVWTKDGEYFDEIFETWWAQYEGRDGFMGYFKSEDISVLNQTGRVKALEVISSLIDYNNGYADSDSPGLEFIPAQKRFMDGQAAFYPCGAWLENEMSEFYAPGTAHINYMRTPVISSIVEKLEYRNGSNYMEDSMLSAVIKAIDSGATSYAGVSESDFAKIKEAREMYYYENIIDSAVIPSFSDAKELAKKFLIYMYSDEGIEKYENSDAGGSLPVYYDYSSVELKTSKMQSTRLEIMGKPCNYIYRPRHKSIASFDFYNTSIQNVLGGISGVKTPQQVVDYTFNYYNANNQKEWNTLVAKKR